MSLQNRKQKNTSMNQALSIILLVLFMFCGYQPSKAILGREPEVIHEVDFEETIDDRHLGGWLTLLFVGLLYNVINSSGILFKADIASLTESSYLCSELSTISFVLFIGVASFLLLKEMLRFNPKFPLYVTLFLIIKTAIIVTIPFLLNSKNPFQYSHVFLSKMFLSSTLSALIWIPYLLISKRVKETFKKRSANETNKTTVKSSFRTIIQHQETKEFSTL